MKEFYRFLFIAISLFLLKSTDYYTYNDWQFYTLCLVSGIVLGIAFEIYRKKGYEEDREYEDFVWKESIRLHNQNLDSKIKVDGEEL